MSAPILQLIPIDNVKVPATRKRPAGDTAQLQASIAALGLLNPITVTADGCVLVAGLNRLMACKALGHTRIAVNVVALDELRCELAELHENLIRNELPVLERAEGLARSKEIYEALHPETRHGGAGRGRPKNRDAVTAPLSFADDLANVTGRPKRSNEAEIRVAKVLTDEQRDALRETPVADRREDLIELTSKKNAPIKDKLVDKIVSGEAKTVKEAIGKLKLDEKRALAAELDAQPVPQPEGRFDVIVIDPPWRYGKRAEDVTHRGRNPYPDMSIEDICALPVADRAKDDCVLWLWTTNAFMRDAFRCLDAWGFAEKTILTWVKNKMGTGDWLRGKTEHCIMAVRGKPVITLTNETTALLADMREHSRKPDEFYRLVNGLCHGAKLDMYSREARDGWAQWGAETDTFGEKK